MAGKRVRLFPPHYFRLVWLVPCSPWAACVRALMLALICVCVRVISPLIVFGWVVRILGTRMGPKSHIETRMRIP